MTPCLCNKSFFGPIVTSIMATLIVLLFLRLIQYNFKTLKSQKINHNDKKIIIFVNISMIVYHLIVVNAALDAKLAPIKRAVLGQSGPGVVEIVGGIGWIFGLAGVAAYFRSRPRD